MAKAKTAKQVAASRRNLVIARSKRRRRIAGGVAAVGIVATTVGAGIVAHRYTSSLKGGPTRPHVPGKELVHVPGLGKTFTRTQVRRKIKRPKPPAKRVFVVNSHGTVSPPIAHYRFNYNQKRYLARGKSLPGKRGVVSTKGSRAAGKKRSHG